VAAGTAAPGLTVCGQGSVTAAWGGSNCGLVAAVNVARLIDGVNYTALFSWDVSGGAPALHGDSGADISFASPFGFGTVGTITATQTGVASFGTMIQAPLFIWGLTLNTPSTP
jgi:hypothetical protein